MQKHSIETDTVFLKTLIDHLPDIILMIDSGGVILYQNESTRRILKFPTSLVGQSLMELVHPDDTPALRQILTLTGRWKESPFATGVRFRREDGSWILLTWRVISFLEHPEFGGIVLISGPAPSGLEDSQASARNLGLRALAEATHHAIIAIDEFNIIHFANAAVGNLFGHRGSDLVGQTLDVLIPERLRALHSRGVQRYVETGIQHANWSAREVYGLHKSGREIPLQASYQELKEGGKRYFVAILEDITSRKMVEQRILTQYAVTRILAGSRNLNETIVHMLKALCTGLGFDYAEVWLVRDGTLECAGTWSLPDLDPGRFRVPEGTRMELSSSGSLLTRVWTTGRAEWISDLSLENIYPRGRVLKDSRLQVGALTPIIFQDRRVGLFAVLAAAREKDPDLIEFLEVLGGQIGDLLERKRGEEERSRLLTLEQSARAAAQESEMRLSFQADASLILSSSLDYVGSLGQIARLVVPRIADWCAVDVFDDQGMLQRIAFVHRDPAKARLARDMHVGFVWPSRSTRGIGRVVRTGEAELYPHTTDEIIRSLAPNQEHYRILKLLGMRSTMIVPLRIRGQPVGAMTFVIAESARTFGRMDLTFAEDLARRGSIAIDNARLHRQSQESLNQLRAKAAEIEFLNRELERRVSERTAQLEAANRELEAFSYSVSHDLRAPVRSVYSFSEILANEHAEHLTQEGRRLLGIITESARKMGRLIDDLLRFSRMGRQSMQRIPLDMTQLVSDVILDIQKSEDATRVQFHVDPLPAAVGDPTMIGQVFMNLVSNAVKFSRKKPQPMVWITGRELETFNSYAVRDNGIGFNMNYAHRLFGVFHRLHHDDEYPGTGVGLALTQRIIHRHGGTISAFSIPDEQTTFSFTLPKASSSEQ